jgi:hypothetical protein
MTLLLGAVEKNQNKLDTVMSQILGAIEKNQNMLDTVMSPILDAIEKKSKQSRYCDVTNIRSHRQKIKTS